MFENLKTKNPRQGTYTDRADAGTYPSQGISPSPGVTSYSIKGNEGSRIVRCRTCGFPCDKERDGQAPGGSWAGLGVDQGTQLSAGTSIGDRRVPAAGVVATTVDQYYARDVFTGCPCCGTLNYAE